MNRQKRDLSEREENLKRNADTIKAKARAEAKEILKEAKIQVDSIINDLKDQNGLDISAVDRKATAARAGLRKLTQQFSDSAEYEGPGSVVSADHVAIGRVFYSYKLQRNITVLGAPDPKGMVSVQAGALKIKLPMNDLSETSEAPLKTKEMNHRSALNTAQMKMDLDIRGYTVDDACLEIERYIDLCKLHGRAEFNIIHGKGTGMLRQGVHSFLKKNKSVSTFRIGAYGEGDAGVTVVTLKNE